MPFKSKSQARFMFSQHPKMAKEWASETPNIKSLPEKKPKRKLKEASYQKSTGGIYVR